MVDATVALIVSALNTAWQTGTHAKPLDGIGASGFTAVVYPDRKNSIQRVEIQRGGTHASLRQTFRIWFAHPTEAAIDYCITLINALTLASTIVCTPAVTWYDTNGYNAIIELVTIQ